MILSLIVAASRNNVIGKDNRLPWHCPADLAHFKQTTQGHTVIMGRKTFESIGKPLPNRRNLVLTRNADFNPAGCEVVNSLEEALQLCANEEEVFVIGGGTLYEQALPLAKRIYLTIIDTQVEGDTPLFEIDLSWQLLEVEEFEADEKNPNAYQFQKLERL